MAGEQIQIPSFLEWSMRGKKNVCLTRAEVALRICYFKFSILRNAIAIATTRLKIQYQGQKILFFSIVFFPGKVKIFLDEHLRW